MDTRRYGLSLLIQLDMSQVNFSCSVQLTHDYIELNITREIPYV